MLTYEKQKKNFAQMTPESHRLGNITDLVLSSSSFAQKCLGLSAAVAALPFQIQA